LCELLALKFVREVFGQNGISFNRFQASVIFDTPVADLGEAETEQITSVIFGLLRQNSFTFLEVLEGAR
jgi:hypothetical protein